VKLISWNVRRSVRQVDGQLEALLSRCPDVIALQEVNLRSVEKYKMGLEKSYFHSVFDTTASEYKAETRRAPSFVLIASRWPAETPTSIGSDARWRHKFLSLRVKTPCGMIEVHTAHIPPGSVHGERKIETLKWIYKALSKKSRVPRILCGDFNTPREELKDGTVVTWGQRRRTDGTVVIRSDRGPGWDEAERDILTGLARWDLPDVYRLLHGYGTRDFSWYWVGKEKRIGRRFDHVFASSALNPVECSYLHAFRKNGLSDHSPIEVIFQH
jgi:exonuclease III